MTVGGLPETILRRAQASVLTLIVPPLALLIIPISCLLWRSASLAACSSSGATDCVFTLWGITFVTPTAHEGLFGFAEFVQALALLAVVYTVTDTRYRFRIAVARIPLLIVTFIVAAVIGAGTLLTDLLFGLQLPLPWFVANQNFWQASLGLLFLLIVMTWIWYAFIRPPTFGKANYKRYLRTLYGFILRGSDNELPAIAAELGRSADALVRFASQNVRIRRANRATPNVPEENDSPGPGDYAREIMLLIGNRKLCRFVISASPGTAIAFFESMTRHGAYLVPLSQFASNITAEALQNTDSVLYHEDHGYNSGLLGYIKPFSKALYGNYELVERLGSTRSPLDVDHEARWSWGSLQVEAYGRIILLTFKSYLESHWGAHSYALYRALNDIRDTCRDAYELDGVVTVPYENEIYARLREAVSFFTELVNALNEYPDGFATVLRKSGDPNRPRDNDMYDHIAESMFEIIFCASHVASPVDTCWSVQYGTVWSAFSRRLKGKSGQIIGIKLRRLLYDEIMRFNDWPNYKSARILGICLNVMGLTIGAKKSFPSDEYALRKAVLTWTKKNFMKIKAGYPDVANACLMGSITFDETGPRLVKSFAKRLSGEVPQEYLELDPAPEGARNEVMAT